MTAKEKVLAVYPSAKAVKIGAAFGGAFYRIALNVRDWGTLPPKRGRKTAEDIARQQAARDTPLNTEGSSDAS
jgi:hypothetical protein